MFATVRWNSLFSLCALAALAGLAPAAHAAITSDATIQVLDQLDVFSSTNVKRSTENPIRLEDLNSSSANPTAVGTAGLTSCQNGRNGLVCLDGQIIRNWPVPKTLTAPPTGTARDTGIALFSCQDDALALDTRTGPCLSATVDISGDIWIAGRKTNTSHNLIRVKRKAGASCTAAEGAPFSGRIRGVAYAGTQFANYCFVNTRTGRPQLLDISAFDGELANAYKGRGILGVENKKTIVFFPSNLSAPVVEVAAGSQLGLIGNESVQSAALLQREVTTTTTSVQTFVVFTTDNGRVLWRDANDLSGATASVIASATGSAPANGQAGAVTFPAGTACDTSGTPNFYEVRVSDTTGRFFVGNRNFCKVFASSPVFLTSSAAISTLTATETVSTTTAFRPEGLSVSPGIAVDLTKCADATVGCAPIPDGVDASSSTQTIPAFKLLNVTLAPSSSAGLIIFQIRNIPDCRKIPTAQECVDAGLANVLPASAPGWLNITPMLPKQVKDLFDNTGRKPTGLPPLLISPRYEAQPGNGYTFDALFGISDPAVVFRKSFTAQFDVGDANLTGNALGCGLAQTLAPDYTQPAPLPFQQWDIATVVSERFGNVGGPTGTVVDNTATPNVDETEHVDMLTNKGCFNPTAGAGTRWSLYAFNLRLAPVSPEGTTYAKPRLYLGNLIKSLYMDLQSAQQKLVCQSADAVGNTTTPATVPPLSGSACTTLQSNWDGTMDKLFKCINAATDPKVSQLDQNCGAFDAQFPSYRAYVASLTPTGPDPANRVGELTSRLDVINYIFYEHFLKAPLDQTVVGP